MTHAEIVEVAKRWLWKRCSLVITETVTAGCEVPDALGFNGADSILVECKASLADFRADAKKEFRANQWQGIGRLRYFMAVAGTLNQFDVERTGGWGLLEIHGDRVKQTIVALPFKEYNHRQETRILLSCLRRIGATAPSGVSIKCYTFQTKCSATLGVIQEDETKTIVLPRQMEPITGW